MPQPCSAGASASTNASKPSPRYLPRIPVDLGDLAGMLSVIADGGIILAKVDNDKEALPRQILLYRDFIRAIFLGT